MYKIHCTVFKINFVVFLNSHVVVIEMKFFIQNFFFLQNISPTPRPDRISKDYEKEYPSIEIEGRRTVRKSPSKEKRNKSHVDNVKLDTEVPQSQLHLNVKRTVTV